MMGDILLVVLLSRLGKNREQAPAAQKVILPNFVSRNI